MFATLFSDLRFSTRAAITVNAPMKTHMNKGERKTVNETQHERPSKTSLTIQNRINAIIGINQYSNYQVALILGKSERYVRDRRKGTRDWSLADIDRYGTATGYRPSEITAETFTLKPAARKQDAKE